MTGFHNATDLGQLQHDLELEQRSDKQEKEFAKGMAALLHAKEHERRVKEASSELQADGRANEKDPQRLSARRVFVAA